MTNLLPADFFVLRRPLCPLDDYVAMQERLRNGTPLAAVLQSVYTDERCREALFYASPAVHAALIAWQEGGPQPSEKLLLTLYKYYVRMTTRSTPFGLFAGISVGHWGEASDLRAQPTVTRHVRLDMGLVSQLISTINALPAVRCQLTYTPNDSLWAPNNTLRYVGYAEQNGQRTYYQNEVNADAHLRQLIEQAHPGLSYEQLLDRLQVTGINTDEAAAYLNALIDNQILCSDLSVNLTGPDPLGVLISRLSRLAETTPIVDQLTRIQTLLLQGDAVACQQIDRLLQNLLSDAGSSLVQCDAFFSADSPVLSTSVRTRLGSTLSDLATRSRPPALPDLDTFKRRFFARYEHQTVPLLEALDPDVGVGYDDRHEVPTPWLDSLPWSASAPASLPETPVSEHLLRLYVDAIRNKQFTIVLSTAELDTILPVQTDHTLPVSGYAVGQLIGDATSSDLLFLLKGMGGPSAANLLGRFAHLSPELEALLCQCLQTEQHAYPNALLAELVHLPATRTGNVLRRPLIRPYEIPILTQSAVAEPQQLPLHDLRIAVPNGQRVMLYSEKLNQPVIPRLSTAHNVQTGGPAHYRFLHDLQHQDTSLRMGWDWGVLKTMPFLPRVQYQNILLSRAQWHVRQADVGAVFDAGWTAWRTTYALPRFVQLAEGDNELVLDMDTPESLALLRQTLNRDGQATLLEWLDITTEPVVRSDNQTRWSHELLIPLRSDVQSVKQPQRSVITPSVEPMPDRRFGPGSRWVYVKLYAGPVYLDNLLMEILPELLGELTNRNLLQLWFFIRYADPEKHLRLRFLAVDNHQALLLKTVADWASQLMAVDSRVYRIQFDTYQREIERFGASTIDECEAWFSHDSQTVVDLLTVLNDQPDWQRLRVGCLFVHQLLTAWQYDDVKQRNTVEAWRDAFLREFRADKSFQTELNTLFRNYRTELVKPAPDEQTLTSLLTNYRMQATAVHRKLRAIDAQSPDRLLPHFSHLFLNRLFSDSQRKNELIVYSFLNKLLKQWINTE